jgi:hypothetical protein
MGKAKLLHLCHCVKVVRDTDAVRFFTEWMLANHAEFQHLVRNNRELANDKQNTGIFRVGGDVRTTVAQSTLFASLVMHGDKRGLASE